MNWLRRTKKPPDHVARHAARAARPDDPSLVRWQRYEQEKAAWRAAHPDASQAEQDRALRGIARRLRV